MWDNDSCTTKLPGKFFTCSEFTELAAVCFSFLFSSSHIFGMSRTHLVPSHHTRELHSLCLPPRLSLASLKTVSTSRERIKSFSQWSRWPSGVSWIVQKLTQRGRKMWAKFSTTQRQQGPNCNRPAAWTDTKDFKTSKEQKPLLRLY